MLRLYAIEVRIPVMSPDRWQWRTVEERTYTAFGKAAAARCERECCREFPTAMVTVRLVPLTERNPVCSP